MSEEKKQKLKEYKKEYQKIIIRQKKSQHKKINKIFFFDCNYNCNCNFNK